MMETIKRLYVSLNYSDKNNHIWRTLVAVKNERHLFYTASGLLESDMLHLFLISDGTWIGDDDEYLERLQAATELIVCTELRICKLLICFETERYLQFKNISYTVMINYFLW